MKLKHPKNLSFILVGASLFLGVAPASAGSDAQVLRKARKQIQALQVLDRFESRYGNAFVIEEAKSAWLRRMERELSFMPDSQAYADGDVCMVAGWPGNFRSGHCRLPSDVRAQAGDQPLLRALNCGSTEKIACNPDIFGLTVSAVATQLDLSTAKRTSPVCVSRKESRMTMACLRESLTVAGAQIPSEAKADLSKFDPSKLSDDDIKKWFWFINSTDGKTSSFSALDAAEKLCKGLFHGNFMAGGGVSVPRSAEEALALLSKDPKRKADLKDCRKVLEAVRKAQPSQPTPPVSDSVTKPEPAAEPKNDSGATPEGDAKGQEAK
jgi:hypothetical protein